MNAMSIYLTDSATMLGRNLRHMRRYPVFLFMAAIPIVFLLLFVYVFGDTLGAGLVGGSGGRDDYLSYVMPGILVMTVAGSATGTAVAVAMDMTEGIVARFRTMSVSRGSFLTGHVFGNMIQTMIAVALVVGVALVIGFRPGTAPLAWLQAIGLLALTALALAWVGVPMGLVSNSVGTASNLPLPFTLLPFLGSGFVPTDSLPEPLRWVAENQPFTPIIETVRGLLFGTDIGNSGWIALGWCVVLALIGYVWGRLVFERNPGPRP
jgi:ABC-2 type transport system permease protein